MIHASATILTRWPADDAISLFEPCRPSAFTPAEARVAARLVLGQNAEQIAAACKTSTETDRTQIKRIFSKTATCRQSELVSLVLGSIPFR